MTAIPVVTVGGPEDLVEGLERLHGPVIVVRRCAELAEVLAACQSGLARAAVVGSGTGALTASLVDRLAALGVAVVALADDDGEAARLRSIGAAVAGAGAAAQELAERITDAVGVRTAAVPDAADGPRHYAGAPGWPADSGVPGPTAAGMASPGRKQRQGQGRAGGAGQGPDGRIIAVWGPAGAPGRTIVAANLAAEMAASGQEVLLVDADTYAASLAATVGLLDESAGLAQACRTADTGVFDAAALERAAVEVSFDGGRFRLLTGLTRADRWPEVRPAALRRVLDGSRALAQVCIVDCGFCLEADEELSYDTVAPRRNGATLCSLAAADTVVAVGAGDPLGIPRLVRALAGLDAAGPGAVVVVVVNKVRPGAAGRRPEHALEAAWDRFGPGAPIARFLPWAPEILDAALLAGRLLIESAPDSALRRALSALAAELCAPAQRIGASAVPSPTAKVGGSG
ncbi:MAG: CpaE family protein [Actinomycetales bacterium]